MSVTAENLVWKVAGLKTKNEVNGDGVVLPQIVTESAVSAEYKTLDYAKLTPLLIEATKELNSKVEQQANEIAELKTLLQKLMETL